MIALGDPFWEYVDAISIVVVVMAVASVLMVGVVAVAIVIISSTINIIIIVVVGYSSNVRLIYPSGRKCNVCAHIFYAALLHWSLI